MQKIKFQHLVHVSSHSDPTTQIWKKNRVRAKQRRRNDKEQRSWCNSAFRDQEPHGYLEAGQISATHSSFFHSSPISKHSKITQFSYFLDSYKLILTFVYPFWLGLNSRHFFSMGEAPILVHQDQQNGASNGSELKDGNFQTTTTIGDKTYVIGGADNETLYIDVRLFDKCLGEWVNPTVLGTKPLLCEGHSAVFLKDRIVVLKKNPKPDDHTWFLEVDTQYVRQQKKKMETKKREQRK